MTIIKGRTWLCDNKCHKYFFNTTGICPGCGKKTMPAAEVSSNYDAMRTADSAGWVQLLNTGCRMRTNHL